MQNTDDDDTDDGTADETDFLPDGSLAVNLVHYERLSQMRSASYKDDPPKAATHRLPPISSSQPPIGNDKQLIIHDVRNAGGGGVASLTGHSSWVLSASVSSDARLIASGSAFRLCF